MDGWMQVKEQFFHDFKDKKLIQFQKQFMSRSPQTLSMANLYKNQIQSKLSVFESNLKFQITQKKNKLVLTESQNRGINDLNKKARALRCKQLSKKEQNDQFEKFWNLYTEDIIRKIDPIRNSKQIFCQVQFFYNDHIKLTNKLRLWQAEYENQSGIQYQKYFKIKLQQFNTKIHQMNPLDAVQIPPVIAISQNATTNIKRKYFDMKALFQCNAYQNQSKIQIKQQFKNSKILLLYKDKEYSSLLKNVRNRNFLNLVKEHINFQRILIEINNSIVHSQKFKIQDYIEEIAIVINKELQQFNRDLKQISYVVSIHFKYLLHDLTKKLIWKKLQLQKIHENKKKQEELKQDQKMQRGNFLGILDTNSQQLCETNAKILIKAYRDFIKPFIEKEKKDFLDEKQDKFFKSFTRSKLQELMDIEIMIQYDPDILYQYLKYPVETITKFYNSVLENDIKQFDTVFICQQKNCINEFELIIKGMLGKLSGTQINWECDVIFQDSFTQLKSRGELSAHLKEMFVQLLINGDTVSADYKNNKFKVKEGVQIEVQKSLSHHINFEFMNNCPEFDISNLALFVQSIQKELDKLKKQLHEMSKLSSTQFDFYKKKSNLILCNATCPFCDRLCDVDMKIDPHHTVHCISSGHQMRAVKGIVVEKRDGTAIEHYASVIRCEEVPKKYNFEFYSKNYIWEELVQQKKNEWNFESKDINKKLFQHIWAVCGQKICDQFSKNGKSMKFIPYSQGTVDFIQSVQQDPTEFIFAIDGSGSMSGQRWNDQLKALQDILSSISSDSGLNQASVLVFNDKCYPFRIRENPRKINVNQIKFPSGLINADPTFIKAAEIMRDVIRTQPKNIYFFYITDGGSDHPSEGIRQLLELKRQFIGMKFKFDFSSILIGDCSWGRKCMQRINQQMGGRSQYVVTSSLSQKLKQILAK